VNQKDLLRLLLLVLAVTCGVQYLRYRVQLDSVRKTMASLVNEWHQEGERAYRDRLLDELDHMGLAVTADDLLTEEDVLHDEIRVELRYRWPLRLLVWELPRDHVASLEAPFFAL
jgi:hypothetical protein